MHSVKLHWVLGLKQKQWVSEEVFKTLYTFKNTIEQPMRSVKVHCVVGFKQKQRVSEDFLSKHYTYSNIQLNNVCALWRYTGEWASSRSNGFQKKFFKTLYIFKHTIEQCVHSVKVNWVVGFKQAQWLAEEVFLNFIHIQTYNWTKYAFCESTLSGGLQAVAMDFRRSFSKHYTYSSIQLNKVCALWKYTEWWPSSRRNGSQKKFFRNIIHIQTYNWTMYALCKGTLSGGLQAGAMARRRSFFKHYAHSNIQLNKVCAPRKYSE